MSSIAEIYNQAELGGLPQMSAETTAFAREKLFRQRGTSLDKYDFLLNLIQGDQRDAFLDETISVLADNFRPNIFSDNPTDEEYGFLSRYKRSVTTKLTLKKKDDPVMQEVTSFMQAVQGNPLLLMVYSLAPGNAPEAEQTRANLLQFYDDLALGIVAST